MALNDPNDRIGIGANEPPLEDRTLLAFDEALNLNHEGLIERIAAMKLRADVAGPCKNDDDAGKMGDFYRMTVVAAKAIEGEREALNRPLLTTQRALKARADALALDATNAGIKVKRLLDTYVADKIEKARIEAARVAEIERQAQAARQKVIDEANAAALAKVEAERKRLQDIEDARVEAERVRLQAIADAEAEAKRVALQAQEEAAAAAEAREVKAVVVEAAVVEVTAEVIEVEAAPIIAAAPVFTHTAAPVSRMQGDFGARVSAVVTWHVEIENIRQVPDLYLKNEAILEALRKIILPSVRGGLKLREIKGCRIYSTTGTAVRG
ncbi:hypothetical protein [Sphingomonas sp. HMP6]|uniref:hypothetical protein n=1 Tax=Sphingomonas sp. HMP6 TaxID=1517551 RepID=UPI001596ECAF|nr:hypothetical protein [Sphingomonas sp. HMP6]BCA57726.1 hypothetical protein HMP06_0495 [Sphingomonas sp. HMP6]